MTRLLALLSVALCASGMLSAQDLSTYWSVTYTANPIPYAAVSVATADDLDGDGVADVAVGVLPVNVVGGPIPNGFVEFRSGTTGALLSTIVAPPTAGTAFAQGVLVLDDLNGDGVRDLAVTAIEPPVPGTTPLMTQVYYFDPITGLQIGLDLGGTAGGWAPTLELISDPDGDGVRSIAVGTVTASSFLTPAGVTVLDPVGAAAPIFFPHPSGAVPLGVRFRGSTIVAVGDRTGDGIEDVVIASTNGTPEQPSASRFDLLSGADFSVIGPALGGATPQVDPFPLKAVADQDGDGLPDLMLSNSDLNRVVVHAVGQGSPLQVSLQASSTLSFTFPAKQGDLGDIDGDGFSDLGAAFPAEGDLRVLSSRRPDAQFPSFAAAQNGLGPHVAAPFGDINGDGVDEFLLSLGNELRLVVNGGAFPIGGTQDLSLDWEPFDLPGVTVGDLELLGAPANASGALGVSVAIGTGLFFGQPLFIDISPAALVLVEPVSFDAQGRFEAGLNLAQPALATTPLVLQGLAVLPGGAVQVSNGLVLDFLPQRLMIEEVTPRAVVGGETVTIHGFGFAPGITLDLDGVATPVTRVDDRTLTFVAPNNLDYEVNIVVRNPSGDVTFTAFNSTPVLTAVAPALVSTGGGVLFILGGPFTPGTTATLGGQALTLLSAPNDGFRQYVAPPGTSGTTVNGTLNVPGGPTGLGTNLPFSVTYQ